MISLPLSLSSHVSGCTNKLCQLQSSLSERVFVYGSDCMCVCGKRHGVQSFAFLITTLCYMTKDTSKTVRTEGESERP